MKRFPAAIRGEVPATEYITRMQRPQHTPEISRSRRGKFAIVAAGVLLALYFGIDSGIRWYVSSQVTKSTDQPMHEFKLVDLAGKTWTLADLAGKTTVLNFFRSKCPSCLRERDVILQLHREADKTKLQVLGVMTDRVAGYPEELTRKTLQRFAYRHPILMADAGFVDAFHGAGWAHVTPITYVVDAKGRIAHALRGHQTLETLRSATQ